MKISVENKKFEINDLDLINELRNLSIRSAFKVKGQKHSVSKAKTLAPVDVEKLNSIKEFVDYAVTEQRFDQAVNEVVGSYEELDVKNIGNLIRWVINDVLEEELDTLTENNLKPKEVNKYISGKTRELFFEKYNSLIGLK